MQKKRQQVFAEIKSTDGLSSLFEKYFYVFLSVILLLALALRIAALLSLKESIYFDFLLWDERVYHTWATKIADGTYESSSVYEFAPLPAYLMAFIYRMLSTDILYIRIANIIFGVLACFFVYLIGKEMAGRKTGVFACLIACLYKPFIFYSIVPLKTSLSVFLFASIIYFLLAILNKDSMIRTLLLGLSIGLMLNVRPQCLVVIPLIPLVVVWNMYKGQAPLKRSICVVVLYILGIFISICPFIVRNYMVAGEIALTTSQKGFNLYQANRPRDRGPVPFATTSPFEQGVQFTIEASRRAGERLSPREASSYWTHEAIEIAVKGPAGFVANMCRKALYFFQQFQLTDHYNIDFMSQFVNFFKIPLLAFNLILPFGMAGMGVNVFRSRKSLALSLIFFTYASTLVIFFTVTRYRLPLLIILIVFAVMGITDFLSYVKKRQLKEIGIYLAIAAAFLVMESLPTRRTGDITAYLNTHAIVLDAKGFEDEAMEYWKKSSQMKGVYSDFANLSLAGRYFRTGDVRRTEYYIDRISDNSFAAAQKYGIVGDMMMHEKHIKKAISAYEKSLDINSGQRRIRLRLARIFSKTDKRRASEEYEKLKYISSFYDIL